MKSNNAVEENEVTKDEFIRFFVKASNYKVIYKDYLEMLGQLNDCVDYLKMLRQSNNGQMETTKQYILNKATDMFGNMFSNLDYESKDKYNEIAGTVTFRKYLLGVLPEINKANPEDELRKSDLQRSPWPSIFMIFFWLTGTGVTYFIHAWLINKRVIDNEKKDENEQDFSNSMKLGFFNIIIAPIFVCSLIFGWTLWIQVPVGAIFALLELVQLFRIVSVVDTCRSARKISLSSDEYKDLYGKVENYLKQGKDNYENKKIKEEEQEEGNKGKDENENEEKPKEEMHGTDKDKNNDDIPVETKNL